MKHVFLFHNRAADGGKIVQNIRVNLSFYRPSSVLLKIFFFFVNMIFIRCHVVNEVDWKIVI